ncbi:MAG: response regulator [Rhizomicrobium sp.]|jgi:CheY-like chemotaxis protein
MASPSDKDTALTVLIAEDEAMLRFVAVETLSDAGFLVFDAVDGSAGLKILESDTKIDLLVSDIKMPGLNGYQLAEAGLALRPELKVVLMTGYAQEPIPEKIKRAGARVIYKPFDFDVLTALAQELLAERH